MNDPDWTPEEDEAFNEIEKKSNLGKQILISIKPKDEIKQEMATLKEYLGVLKLKVETYMFLGKETHKRLKQIDLKVKELEKQIKQSKNDNY